MSRNLTRRDAILSASVAMGLSMGAQGVAGADELGEQEATQTAHTASDVVRFLYIDNKQQDAGAEQSVVVALDLGADVASGTLTLSCLETGDEVEVEMSAATGSAALFALGPDEGTYSVSELTVTLADGSRHLVDFGDIDASYRSFAVGRGALATLSAGKEGEVETTVSTLSSAGASTETDSLESGLALAASQTQAQGLGGAAARSAVAKDFVVVALDPGHGGSDGGAQGNGGSEATINWKIAEACRAELETYAGVRVFMTRGENETKTIEQRIVDAIRDGADVVVSLHINSGSTSAYGAEVWVPSGVDYNYETHEVGQALGESIISELEALGLYNRGVKIRTVATGNPDTHDYDYPDGSLGDYYGVIRYARRGNIPGIIVEHAFISNESDYNEFLSSDAKLKKLGVADAEGIASYYGLVKADESDFTAVYDYNYYVLNNSGVPSSRTEAFNHFLKQGMVDGLQASASFSPFFYRNYADNADLRAAFGSEWSRYYYHYIARGKAQGRPATGSTEARVVMWRLYNSYSGEHFYTSSDVERRYNVYLGWNDESVGWEAPTSGDAVYRLYNPYVDGGDHHYTMSAEERDELVDLGWKSEGTGWYSAPEQTGTPLYRQYNPNATTGTHNYTTDKAENDALVEKGWKEEGIGWYGI